MFLITLIVFSLFVVATTTAATSTAIVNAQISTTVANTHSDIFSTVAKSTNAFTAGTEAKTITTKPTTAAKLTVETQMPTLAARPTTSTTLHLTPGLTPSVTTTISPLVLRELQYNPDQKVGGGLCWPGTPNVCHSNGLCVKDQSGAHSECRCFAQFGGPECEQKQKSQLVAFLLALLLGGLGAGRFYLGYIALGIFKLLYHCVFLTIAAVNRAMLKEEGTEPHPVIALFSCCCCCGWFIWWIHDAVVIGNGSLTAVDGIGMYLNM